MYPSKGFTLIELLVVVTIVGTLSLIGYAAYRGITKGVADAKRQADINAISTAYENKYQDAYSELESGDFISGSIPKDPRNTDYYNVIASNNSGYRVCAALEDNSSSLCNSSSQTCYCRSSERSDINLSGATLSGPGSELGLGGTNLTHSPSCDTTQTLHNGLNSYWRMDEPSWNGTSNEVINSAGANNGTAQSGANITPGNFNNAGNFDGTNDAVILTNPINFAGYSGFTVSAWIKPNNINTRQNIFNNGHGLSFEVSGGGIGIALRAVIAGVPQWTGTGGGPVTTQWQHVAIVYTPSSYRVYRNGALIAQNTQGAQYSHSGSSTTYIGNTNPGFGNFPYNGSIDDVRIYNRDLSLTEVTNLWNNGSGCIP